MDSTYQIYSIIFVSGLLVGALVPWRRILLGPVGWLYRALSKDTPEADMHDQSDDASFRLLATRLLSLVAAIDTPVNSQEIQGYKDHFLRKFRPEGDNEKEELLAEFLESDLEGRNTSEKIANFYWKFSSRKEDLLSLTQIAIELIIIDGAKNGSEAHVLDVLAKTFGIHPKNLFRMEEQILQDYYERMGYASSKSQQSAKGGSNRNSRQSSDHGKTKNRNPKSSLQSMALSKYYRVLGCPPGASRSQIKRAYRTLVKQHHPDSSELGKSDGGKHFREVQSAYDALRRAGRV